MDKIKYVNHFGESLDLRSHNIMSSYFAVKNFVHSVANDRLVSEGKSIPLPMVCLTKADANRLIDVLEKDSINNIYGKFYINDWYIKVMYQGFNILGEFGDRVKLEINFYADDTIFTKEVETRLVAQNTVTGKGLNFPFGYPFNFGADPIFSSAITNDELLEADFIIKIDQPTSEVNITVGEHSYVVDYEIGENEVFVLNTFEKSVYVEGANGKASLLGAASDSSYIFATIPQGYHKVLWSGDYPITFITLIHRRTPKWI